jgi:hypothetical protein
VVFVCAVAGAAPADTAAETLAQRGEAYGIRAQRIDGADVREVAAAVRAAAEVARGRGGATLIEAVLGGRDPLATLRGALEASGEWDDALDDAGDVSEEARRATCPPGTATFYRAPWAAPEETGR